MRVKDTEIYTIPLRNGGESGQQQNDDLIVYSPLAKVFSLIKGESLPLLYSSIESSLEGEKVETSGLVKRLLDYELPLAETRLRQSPHEYTTLSLLPNLICNFRCHYCYSAEGRSNKTIDKQKLTRVLDWFINPQRILPQTLKMFISGGGEPFLSWENTQYAIHYAHERARELGFTLWASVITNGSVVNEDIINTLKRYKCSVCVSFEVLEDIQNNLRGKYHQVADTIRSYGQSGIPVMLNSTITPLSVNRMLEMAEEVITQYPFVRNYTLEPVTDYTQFDSPESLRLFYQQFRANYQLIKEKYKHSKTSFWCSLDEIIDTLKMRYCPGKLCLTPNGTFSICHCASSPLEERYEKCVYGKVTENEILFDMKKFRSLISINAHNKEKCKDCFAKWNCGGECMTRSDQYPEEYMDEVCHFNREWLLMQIKERVDKPVNID